MKMLLTVLNHLKIVSYFYVFFYFIYLFIFFFFVFFFFLCFVFLLRNFAIDFKKNTTTNKTKTYRVCICLSLLKKHNRAVEKIAHTGRARSNHGNIENPIESFVFLCFYFIFSFFFFGVCVCVCVCFVFSLRNFAIVVKKTLKKTKKHKKKTIKRDDFV